MRAKRPRRKDATGGGYGWLKTFKEQLSKRAPAASRKFNPKYNKNQQ